MLLEAWYPRQRVIVVACESYAYLVPFVERKEHFFLKTVIPGREATRDYLDQGDTDAEQCATGIKESQVNIRLSSGDLSNIQVKVLDERVPYQTLIASMLHKYVTSRLAESTAAAVKRTSSPVSKRRSTSDS